MFRTLLPVLLYVAATTAAPPESNITYVKISPPDPQPTDAEPLLQGSEEVVLADEEKFEEFSTTVSDDLTEEVTETEIYETTEPTTTTTKRPKRYKPRAKSAAPTFFSKLSYFQKLDHNAAVNLNQLDGTPGKRRFVSKCRCEKIWNCPKLQITVPRCPNEYFLCCF